MNALIESHAQLQLPEAARTLRRLCKHFSHKVMTECSDTEGRVVFAEGYCRLQASGQQLHLECGAKNLQELREIELTLERHLPAMAGAASEPAEIHWQR